MLSQYWALVPKKRPRRAAVSAVIARWPLTIRLMRPGGTRIARASALILIPSSFRSSSRMVPGWIGASLVIVRDFDIGWSFLFPGEANPILIIDANAVLP